MQSAIQIQGMHNTASSHILFPSTEKPPAEVKMCYRRAQTHFHHCFISHNQNYNHSDLYYHQNPMQQTNCQAIAIQPLTNPTGWSKLIQRYSGCISEAGFVSYTMLLSTLQRPQTWLITFAWDPPSTQNIVESCWSRTTVAPSFTPGVSQTCHLLFKVPLTGQIYSS